MRKTSIEISGVAVWCFHFLKISNLPPKENTIKIAPLQISRKWICTKLSPVLFLNCSQQLTGFINLCILYLLWKTCTCTFAHISLASQKGIRWPQGCCPCPHPSMANPVSHKQSHSPSMRLPWSMEKGKSWLQITGAWFVHQPPKCGGNKNTAKSPSVAMN